MAWCHHAIGHYLSQSWPSSMSPYHDVTSPQWVDIKNDFPLNHSLFIHWVYQEYIICQFILVLANIICIQFGKKFLLAFIGLGNGLVPTGNKLLTKSMTQKFFSRQNIINRNSPAWLAWDLNVMEIVEVNDLLAVNIKTLHQEIMPTSHVFADLCDALKCEKDKLKITSHHMNAIFATNLVSFNSHVSLIIDHCT